MSRGRFGGFRNRMPDGADGAVRIIWGPNRSFPTSNTVNTQSLYYS